MATDEKRDLILTRSKLETGVEFFVEKIITKEVERIYILRWWDRDWSSYIKYRWVWISRKKKKRVWSMQIFTSRIC